MRYENKTKQRKKKMIEKRQQKTMISYQSISNIDVCRYQTNETVDDWNRFKTNKMFSFHLQRRIPRQICRFR